ncbi:prephenate dehydratase [Candidatus Nitrosocosmicus franklandus]|uniref:prephenate dehydratase n=1 Tax=Candidatus Nitrosocosmicus franklandianus TaxID=1798806 RepID=A0A484I8W6_9ARCH|nr:prephenate dehydratase [Candidatus Nitrosocosmicus franklandus]VFJ14201.1 p-protein [Candidatus Nitrosocosmicus franklandus]
MKLCVGFQGESGSYSEASASSRFPGPHYSFVPFKSFRELFDGIENSVIDLAVVPIENSTEGSVNETYDLLVEKPLFVIGEIYQEIHHCLIINKHSSPENISVVYSHPQALAQCRRYLQSKSLDSIPMYDTAGSVKFIKESMKLNAAAIASKRAAQIYDMKILDENIEDNSNNYTRFFIISKTHKNEANHDKISIIFSIPHTPGSLYSVLKEFASRKINLTKIESRPTKNVPWEYYFFVDLEGNMNERRISESISSIQNLVKFFKLLGTYKKAEIN